MKRILLVDFMGSVYYHYHAKEKHVEYNFIKNLHDIIEAFKVDKTFILCEGGGSTYRQGLLPNYKATRKARKEKQTPEEKKEFAKFLACTNSLLKDMLPLLGVAVVNSWGSEADDLAGYLCHLLPSEEYQILLLTEDSDWSQLLVRPNTVWGSYKEMTKELLNRERWKNAAAFERAKGMSVETLFLKKMLMGDKSDDVPGITGIGETFADKIVVDYPTVADIIANKDNINYPRLTDKAREGLRNCEETFDLGFKLMNLRWDKEHQWGDVLGKENLAPFQEKVKKYLSMNNSLDTEAFNVLSYTHGWLVFTDEGDRWFQPFL